MDRTDLDCYFKDALFPEDRERLVQNFMRVWQKESPRCDFVVATGYSGLALAPIIAHKLSLPLVLVRQKGWEKTSTHATYAVESHHFTHLKGQKGLFIDDFVMSGATLKWVKKNLKPFGATIYSQFHYADSFSLSRLIIGKKEDIFINKKTGKIV